MDDNVQSETEHRDKNEALKNWEHAIDILPDDNDSKALNNIGNFYKNEKEVK